MNLKDLLPAPDSIIKTIKAPFESRDGMPWAQSTARNLGHAAFGDKIGDYVDQRMLGDSAPGDAWQAPQSMGGQPMQQQAQTSPMEQLIQTWLAQGKKPNTFQ